MYSDGYVVREEIGKKSDDVARYIPMNCETIQIVLYVGCGCEDNIFDIIEGKPCLFVRKNKKATMYLQRIIDSCYTFDIIAFQKNGDDCCDEVMVVKEGCIPWHNDNPSLNRSYHK
jgi:hypothetical protein